MGQQMKNAFLLNQEDRIDLYDNDMVGAKETLKIQYWHNFIIEEGNNKDKTHIPPQKWS